MLCLLNYTLLTRMEPNTYKILPKCDYQRKIKRWALGRLLFIKGHPSNHSYSMHMWCTHLHFSHLIPHENKLFSLHNSIVPQVCVTNESTTINVTKWLKKILKWRYCKCPYQCLDYISITIYKEMKILSSQKHHAIFYYNLQTNENITLHWSFYDFDLQLWEMKILLSLCCYLQ
jgi:hypothetical protein